MLRKRNIKVAYVSDAHLFSGGFSEGVTLRTLNRLANILRNHDLVVLNGDTFELPFSEIGFSKTVARAISALQVMLEAFPEKEINYTIGNHDGDPVFVYLLHQMAQHYPNFRVTEKHLLLEDTLSSHGDLMHENQVQRDTEFPDQRSFGNIISEIQVKLLDWTEARDAKIFAPHAWSPRVDTYLETYDNDFHREAATILTGHTHAPFGEFVYGKKRYSNTGALFDDNTFYPILKDIGTASYTAYQQQAKPEPKITNAILTERAQNAFSNILRYSEINAGKISQLLNNEKMAFQEKMLTVQSIYDQSR
jgi:hypothetical protein